MPCDSSHGRVNPTTHGIRRKTTWAVAVAAAFAASVAVPGSPAHRPVRVSTHLFHTRDDVDRMVEAAWKLSNAMA